MPEDPQITSDVIDNVEDLPVEDVNTELDVDEELLTDAEDHADIEGEDL